MFHCLDQDIDLHDQFDDKVDTHEDRGYEDGPVPITLGKMQHRAGSWTAGHVQVETAGEEHSYENTTQYDGEQMIHSFQPWPGAQEPIDEFHAEMSVFTEQQGNADEHEPSEEQIDDLILWCEGLDPEVASNHLGGEEDQQDDDTALYQDIKCFGD